MAELWKIHGVVEHADVSALLDKMIVEIKKYGENAQIWGVPTAGGIIAQLCAERGVKVANSPENASVAVDDVYDSGSTYRAIHTAYKLHTIPLIDKRLLDKPIWIQFPWDNKDKAVDTADAIARLLQSFNFDTYKGDMADTPERVARALAWMWRGLNDDCPKPQWSELTVKREQILEPINIDGINFSSTCEHHLMPFWGKVDIIMRYHKLGYHFQLLGLSKYARIVEWCAARPTLQERLTHHIADTLKDLYRYNNQASGDMTVSVRTYDVSHTCVSIRGVEQDYGIDYTASA